LNKLRLVDHRSQERPKPGPESLHVRRTWAILLVLVYIILSYYFLPMIYSGNVY
jgi:hypothetical protein